MRIAEWINLIFFSFFTVLALLFRLNLLSRIRALIIGISGTIVSFSMQFFPLLFTQNISTVLRDWLPLAMIPLAYWQPGNFFQKPKEGLQRRLQQWDQIVLGPLKNWNVDNQTLRMIQRNLELLYLFCYPFVPLGFTILYVVHSGLYIDEFWLIVLPPTYSCYAMVPFTQTLPPRSLLHGIDLIPYHGKIRILNLWILRHASIHANTLPSAHVAASLAVSLALLLFAPWAGILSLLVSAGIAVGAVTGRYHYSADICIAAVLTLSYFIALLL